MDILQLKTLLFDFFILICLTALMFFSADVFLIKICLASAVFIDFMDILVFTYNINPKKWFVRIVEVLDCAKVLMFIYLVVMF